MSNKGSGKGRGKRKPKPLLAHVTHLEMTHPLTRHIAVPTRPVIALMRAQYIPSEFCRFLYEMVGKPHHWQDRRNMADADLYSLINDPACEVHVLYADGCPAGFFELGLDQLPDSVNLTYFGLGAEYQGLSLGKWFLGAAISSAWAHKPKRLTVQTNTLDHPAALPLYQKLGFSPTRVSDEEVIPWE